VAKGKGNKNNPDNKGGNVKQNKLRDSAYCENNCKDVLSCEKYKNYVLRMIGRACYGISCSK